MADYGKNLVCYKTLSVWTATSLPEAFKVRHNTKSGTWAKLKILSGFLTMEFLSDEGGVIEKIDYCVENQPPLIEPKQYHRIAWYSEDMTCQLSFYTQEGSED